MKQNSVFLDCRFWGSINTGLGRYTESMVSQLHRLKPPLNIYLLVSQDRQAQIKSRLPRFKIIPCGSRHYSLSEQLEIPQLINKLKPDLTHFLHFNVPLRLTSKYVVTIHDLTKHHSKGVNTTTKSPIFYPLKRFGYHLTINHAIKESQLILTPSNWVKQDILRFYSVPQEKIIVTPEAAAKIYLSQRIKPSVHNLYKYSYLIYVGNAYPHKNVLQLIKAAQKFNLINQKKIKLVIITPRNIFYERLRHQIRLLKAQSTVKLKDFTSDSRLKLLYRHSVAFITASLFEGFGLPGLEAMASQTLVLSSNRASLPEVYGSAAIYFNPENLDEMIDKINYALNLDKIKRQALIAKAYLHAKQFSWEKTAKLTLNAYQKVLNS